MLKLGIIEVGESDYMSPMILVEIAGKEPRPCIDYRKLNGIIRTEYFPLPNIEERVEKVSAAKFITVFDLSKGYWQIPLSKTAQRYAAFCTSFGTYRPLRMSFGLKNAPYFFSKLMAELLNGLEDFVVPYLDDIAIFSDTWESHIKHMETVLQRIKRAKLTIKPSKCKFAQQNVKFLGHIVGQGFRTPSEIKVQAVLEFPTPRTKTQIRAFLGIAGYYQKYINLFSVIAAPLTDALKGRAKKGEIKWTTECENAFRELKGKLIDKPVLYAPNFEREFIVQTDASNAGMGAVLTQLTEQGEEHPILYLSKKFSEVEKRYCTTEKECASIVFAIKRLHYYLDGNSFLVMTDHNPLVWLNRNVSSNPRLMRWALALQPYNFRIVHRSVEKLDRESRRNFQLSLKSKTVPTFQEFIEFLEQRESVLLSVSAGRNAKVNPNKMYANNSKPNAFISKWNKGPRLSWNTNEDYLTTDTKSLLEFVSLDKNTKRFMLQAVGKIFDPLGLISPFTVRMKCPLQDLWKEEIQWDDPLPTHIEKEWKNGIPTHGTIVLVRKTKQTSRGLSADCLESQIPGGGQVQNFLSDSEFPKNFQQVVPELDYLTEHEKETVVQERKNCLKLTEVKRLFNYNCRNKSKKVEPLTVAEFKESEIKLIKHAQRSLFDKKEIPSCISNLFPFVDGEVIVCVGGRLENASVPYLHKHPAILPKGSKLSKLYFNSLHTRLFHVGPQGLLNAVRQKFWPLSGRSIACKTVHQCVTCFKSRPILSSQIMGNLPSERVNISTPFTIAGLDLCGPFLVKYKNQRKGTLNKVYICVCICFSTKAIHLELLSDLTSDALVATLKRF
ncbi:retrovirus-related Pol polyprotein from transposon 297 [Trichonephila clavipes]|nr:retrovirus-related Pol polyprotein from transposon 297 [Trichonephila clavipes]